MMSDELKPCPHCGNNDYVTAKGETLSSDNYQVVCDFLKGGCGASGGVRRTESEAIAAWNTRANEPHEYEPYEPDDSHECASCGCVVDYDVHDDGSWAIMANDYQIPYRFCPQCGADVHADDTPELPQDDACAILRKNLYDVGDLGRAMGILEPNELVGGSGDRAYIFERLADLIERDYVRRDSIADDAQVIKNVENYKLADDSRPQVIAISEKHKSADKPDSREKLEADVYQAAEKMEEFTHGEKFINTNKILRWLDRQAAITERELCGRCSPYATAKDYLDTIDELTAERDTFKASYLRKKDLAEFWHNKYVLRKGRVDELTAELDACRLRERAAEDYDFREAAERWEQAFEDKCGEVIRLQEALDAMGNGQFYAMYEELRAEVDNLRKRNDSQADTIRRLRSEFDASLDDLARAVEDKRSHPF